jgi:hypothetical protein
MKNPSDHGLGHVYLRGDVWWTGVWDELIPVLWQVSRLCYHESYLLPFVTQNLFDTFSPTYYTCRMNKAILDPSTGQSLSNNRWTAIAENAIYHDPRHLSNIELPVIR